MQITNRQLGIGIGVCLIVVLTLLAGYLPVAWVLWDWNPANWPAEARVASLAIPATLHALRWAILRVKIVRGNDDEN